MASSRGIMCLFLATAALAFLLVAPVVLSERSMPMHVEVIRGGNMMDVGDAVHILPVQSRTHYISVLGSVSSMYIDFDAKRTEFFDSCFEDVGRHVCDKEFARTDRTKGIVLLVKLAGVKGLAQFKTDAPRVYRELSQLSLQKGYPKLVFPGFCSAFDMTTGADKKEAMKGMLDWMSEVFTGKPSVPKLVFYTVSDKTELAWREALSEYKSIPTTSAPSDQSNSNTVGNSDDNEEGCYGECCGRASGRNNDPTNPASGIVRQTEHNDTNMSESGFMDTVKKNKPIIAISVAAAILLSVYYKITLDRKRATVKATSKV